MDSASTSALNPVAEVKQPLRFMERIFLRLLRNLHSGSLKIEFPSGASAIVGDSNELTANLKILDSSFFGKVINGGSVGLGETYMEGLWSTEDLSALLKLLAKNQQNVGGLRKGFSFLARQFNRFIHLSRRNTVKQSRQNIQEHYDLSNDFYSLWLDETMTYSSALFTAKDESLKAAQINKIDRMLDLSGIQAGQHILEIGTGWGAMALRAAQRGCRVTTITLSEEQLSYAKERFIEAGIDSQIDLRLQDYRDLEGQFDAVVSCEMIEAVGKEYLPSYFQKIGECLKPGARAVIQAITIPDERYEAYCGSCDWIQKHIFPGGHLPSPGAIEEHVHQAGDMEVLSMSGFGYDYAETLRRWADTFNASIEPVEKLGFDERFQRKWNYYLSYCEAGFDADLIDVKHVVVQAK